MHQSDQNTGVNFQSISSEVKQLDIEEAMEKVGQKHKYQYVVVIFSMVTMFIATFCYMVTPYYLSPPTFECLREGIWKTCTEDDGACDKGIQVRLSTSKTFSISTELDLYCDNRNYRTITQSLPYFGCIVGIFVFNYLSDNKGRLFSLRLCWTLGSVFAIIMNFAVNIPMLMVGSFGLGFGIQALITLLIVQCNELSIGQFRVIAVILIYVAWAANEMQYMWLLDLLPNWKWCTFICFTAPIVLLNIVPFTIIRDSPRFLYQKNREKCLQSLNYIAKFNNREGITSQELKEVGRNEDRIYSYLDLFRYSSQRKTTFFMMILFIAPHIYYYGIQVSLDQLGSSFQENSLFIGIGEFIGYLVSDVISHKIPRKKGTFYSLLVTCLICISFLFFQIPDSCSGVHESCWQKPFQTFMAALSRCIVALTFSLIVLFCGETYPTTLKSVGYGLCFGSGFVGSFSSPYIVDLSNRMGILPVVSLGVITLSGCIAVLFLKETLGQPLLDEIPELIPRAQSRKSSIHYQEDIQGITEQLLSKQDDQNIGDKNDENQINNQNQIV